MAFFNNKKMMKCSTHHLFKQSIIYILVVASLWHQQLDRVPIIHRVT